MCYGGPAVFHFGSMDRSHAVLNAMQQWLIGKGHLATGRSSFGAVQMDQRQLSGVKTQDNARLGGFTSLTRSLVGAL